MTKQVPAASQACDGFPDRCPYLLTVDPNPPHHEGGVRCGCNARQDLEDMAVELATGIGLVDPREYKAALDRYAAQTLRAFAASIDELPRAGEALRGKYWYLEGRRETADMARERAEDLDYEAEQRVKDTKR